MLPAMRTYGLMIFIAALLLSPLLQLWMGRPTAILLVTLGSVDILSVGLLKMLDFKVLQ